MLALKNVHKKYGSRQIVDDVSLTAQKGDVFVFLGPSGVGKSTLLRMLCGLEKPDAGTIELDSQEITPEYLAQTHAVGMVFQQFNLFPHLTIEENITLPLEQVLGISKQDAQATARKLLEHYGLASKAQQYPDELSGGQKQRLALARTIALKPKVICLDEPTSALDPLLTAHVAKTISELAGEGYTIFIASHDTELLKRLPCTVHLMQEGTVVETAKSADFFAHPEKFPLISRFVSGIQETS